MDIYSAALGAALVALAISLAGLIVARRRARRAALRYSVSGAVVALAFAILALGSHQTYGHPAGTSSALPPAAFLAAHPATIVIAGAAAILLWLSLARGVPKP